MVACSIRRATEVDSVHAFRNARLGVPSWMALPLVVTAIEVNLEPSWTLLTAAFVGN